MEKSNEKKQRIVKRFYEPKTSPLVDINEWTVDEEGHHHIDQERLNAQ